MKLRTLLKIYKSHSAGTLVLNLGVSLAISSSLFRGLILAKAQNSFWKCLVAHACTVQSHPRLGPLGSQNLCAYLAGKTLNNFTSLKVPVPWSCIFWTWDNFSKHKFYESADISESCVHHNPNPRARKTYLTLNRVINNVVATPGFDRTPAP